jgi:hypothetical protein
MTIEWLAITVMLLVWLGLRPLPVLSPGPCFTGWLPISEPFRRTTLIPIAAAPHARLPFQLAKKSKSVYRELSE